MNSISFGNDNSGFEVGVNQGSIYLSQERPEPRPEPLSTVPFPRDPEFVARDALLEQIHEKASTPGSRIVLVGLGGVGKTQLAIEYCHRIRQQYNEMWVFWIHASNVARCEKSLRDLADRAKIPGRRDRNAHIFQIVGDWLQDEKIGKWILVLDNVDDDELLHKPLATTTERQVTSSTNALTKPPLRFLLESSNGSIIITSRNKRVALDIASHKNVIEVQSMNKAEALDLLQKKLNMPGEREEMEQLVETLELMPLAIVQAAAYITHRSPRFSVSQYLEKILKSDREAVRLLNYEAGLLYRDWEAKNSILLTWQISFNYIQAIRPSAAGLLSLMSFFDWQGIPESILQVQQSQEGSGDRLAETSRDTSSEEEDEDYASSSNADQQLEDDIILLHDYSLILIGEHSTVLTMHRLVQLTVRIWLKTHGQFENWKEIFINNLYHGFPTREYENWEICQSLFPHIRSALFHRPKSRESLEQWATLLFRGAWYAWKSGNLAEATYMASKSRQERLKILGEEHDDTLEGSMMLAIVYEREGRWEDAEQYFLQVMKTHKTQLGEDHPRTLSSINRLAGTYWIQGRFGEAEQLFIQVMEKSKTKLGEDHPNTLASISNVAAAYRKQGRWEEAEQLQVQVLEKSKIELGEDHPSTILRMANLAAIYWNQGRWEEAEQLFVQVIEARKTKLSKDHPEMLSYTQNLALTYHDQGRWEEAEQLFMQVIEARKIKLSKDHPDTLTSMHNLASTYMNQGRLGKAEQLYKEVLQTRKTKIGKDHPDTLMSMSNLALVYHDQDRWEEAEQLNIEVIEIRKLKLGIVHPDTLISIGNLALVYLSQGRGQEAEQLQVQVMKTHKTKLGDDHPNTPSSMAILATTYWKLGRGKEAEKLLVQVVEKSKAKLGEDHPSTISRIANLAAIYWNQDQWDEAEQLQVQVLEKSKIKFGEDNPDTLSSMKSLAATYWKQGRWDEAEQLQLQVMEKSKAKLGENHPDTLSRMATLAFTWRSLGRNANAIVLLKTCVARQQQAIGSAHPDTLYNSNELLEWEKTEGDIDASSIET